MLYSCGVEGAPFDLTRAQQQLESALDLNRAETGSQVRLGEIALLQADLRRARQHLDAARATNARSLAAHYLAGYVAWQSGDSAAALAALTAAVRTAGGGVEERSASSEGQTRRGHRPLLESGHAGLLASQWQHLARWGGTLSLATTGAEYERFHQALAATRARLPRDDAGGPGWADP
jgi:uncharacterized protein HemY